MNYLFKVGSGLDNLTFDTTESDALKLLGNPDKIEREVYENAYESIKDETVRFYYKSSGLKLKFNYFDNEYDGLTISTNKLIYNSEDWFSLSKRKVIKIIKEIHQERNLVYVFEKEKYKNSETEEYNFNAIGLTIWFEDNRVDDLCIFRPYNVSLSVSQPKPYVFAEPTTEMIAAEPEIAYNKTIS